MWFRNPTGKEYNKIVYCTADGMHLWLLSRVKTQVIKMDCRFFNHSSNVSNFVSDVSFVEDLQIYLNQKAFTLFQKRFLGNLRQMLVDCGFNNMH